VIPTFFDLRTGRTAKGSDESVVWWTEGNGVCDCNRMLAFGLKPKDIGEVWFCLGCKRFVAIDVEGDLGYVDYDGGCKERVTKEQVLIAMNAGYGK